MINFEPAIVFVEGDPGERVMRELIIKNQTRLAIHLSLELLDMQEGRGNSTALDYVAAGAAPRGAADWVRPLDPAEFGMAPITQQSFQIVVDIPKDAGAGGYYAALQFTIPDPRKDAQFPIRATAPVPILVTVTGDAERDLRTTVTPTERWKWRGGRGTWVVELRNEGDVHEVFAGRLRVEGAFGGATSKPIRKGILLPGERRTQRISFDLRDAPDLVGAHLRVERDTGDARTDDAPRMLVLPWWLLVLLAVAVAVVAWRLRFRRYGWESSEGEGVWDPSPPAG